MGLSPYSTPADAGVLCVILVNTAISISIVKEIVRSILSVIGIRIASWEDYTIEGPLDTLECRGTPSESYIEEFRSRTPPIRYDAMCISNNPEQECSVCLAEFKPDAEINQLPCGHVFHTACLEKWLKYWNVTCPLCRNYMIPQGEDDGCPINRDCLSVTGHCSLNGGGGNGGSSGACLFALRELGEPVGDGGGAELGEVGGHGHAAARELGAPVVAAPEGAGVGGRRAEAGFPEAGRRRRQRGRRRCVGLHRRIHVYMWRHDIIVVLFRRHCLLLGHPWNKQITPTTISIKIQKKRK